MAYLSWPEYMKIVSQKIKDGDLVITLKITDMDKFKKAYLEELAQKELLNGIRRERR